MKTRVALYEEPGGQMIIRRDGSPEAFILLDSPAGNFASDAAELATTTALVAARGRSIFVSFRRFAGRTAPVSSSLSGRRARYSSSASPAAAAPPKPTSQAGRLCVTSDPSTQGLPTLADPAT